MLKVRKLTIISLRIEVNYARYKQQKCSSGTGTSDPHSFL
jgi:hypothetical protein